MIRFQLFITEKQKAKLFNEAKDTRYDGSAGAVIRDLIDSNL